ncbi:MAG: protein phosphatase 2C domain-containing protein [Albidovulum sp.]|uniref:PP2C family protein-serine/threonine phosphatase n=1 Tax=Albidovulum sp. TaxID=1872424 RepID=UPI003CA680F6
MRSATTVVPVAALRFPVASGAGLTHRGLVRDRNEDAILTDPTGRLWAVADGMGGLGHGDVASDIVIDSLETIDDEDAPAQALRARLTDANQIMRARASEPGMGEMGATVVAAIVAGAQVQIAWIGDSRAYLLRGGRLRLITRDHTLVQDLVDRGELSAEAAENHPESHIITRAVGGDDLLELEQLTLPVTEGDRLLLCSDGLPRCVYEPAIAGILTAAVAPADACRDLIRAALEAGAPDNVSVIVVDIRES